MLNEIERQFMSLKEEKNPNYRLIQLKKLRNKLMIIIFCPVTSKEKIKTAEYLLKKIEFSLN